MRRNSCCVKQKLRKGLWSPEEDEKLYNYIKRFGVGCWSSVPKLADLQRCGKSCRLRWINYLRPDLKRGMFSQEEESLIISLHETLGNRWAQIATQLPGRTDNEIKNFWNSSLKKKLMKQGIDPNNHKPMAEQQQLIRPDDITDCADHANSLQSVLQPKGLPNLASSTPMENQGTQNLNHASKQAFDSLFLPEFQENLDPDHGFQSNFQNLLRPFDLGSNPIDPICGFNSMPNLTNFDHQGIIDTEYSDNSGSRMSNITNLGIIPTNNSRSLEHTAATLCWDMENKMDPMFPFQFSGMQQEAHHYRRNQEIHDHNSGHYSNCPISSFSRELSEVFQQM